MENTRFKATRKLRPVFPGRGNYVLLNPGPCNTSTRVKYALLKEDMCHRDAEFSDVVVRLTDKLRRIFRGSPEHAITLITGSGTSAMECALASCVPHDKKLLVIDNGAFGQRLAEIAGVHDMDIVHLQYDIGQTINLDDVKAALVAHPDIAVVTMAHHETSVGLLNPIREVGQLCRDHDCLFLADAVSSLGAEDLDVVRDQIDVCFSSANKCLHGIAGISFLCVHPRVWARIANVKARVYYLDLKRYRKIMVEKSQTPFTPAVNACCALEAACDEYLRDGATAREAMYVERNDKLRSGLHQLGMDSLTDSGDESNSIVTVTLPPGWTFSALYTQLKELGYIVYNCKAPLQGRYFQIANMGELPDGTLDAFLSALEGLLSAAGARARVLAS